ncbi:hypothetical protein ANCDUO_04650 [Ancylostoma duodenale]|uniref:Uncharacterized protein n=1 Tax=Ancylostoma duodenale TaxID=51022 RepID=A0A0C2H0H9_9BILA|nr:hypothetical protein ANCDUO_04650 [Ancylostoma duodenale]
MTASPLSTEWDADASETSTLTDKHFQNFLFQPPQFSWKSYGRANDEGDEDEWESEQVTHEHCDCAVAFERAKEWVDSLPCNTIWRSYSDELLTFGAKNRRRGMCNPRSLIRAHSALSCVSMEKLPVLKTLSICSDSEQLGEMVEDFGARRRSSSFSTQSSAVRFERSASVPPEWKPVCPRNHPEPTASLCESRRDRLMYPRNLSACRYRVYGVGELLAKRRSTGGAQYAAVRVPTHREEDPPVQWIRRDSSNRHDLLKAVRFWLEGRTQRNIPVLWFSRTEERDSPMVIEEARDEGSEIHEPQVTTSTEQRECPLEYPIAVYNPPPTWKMFMEWKRKEKRAEKLSESLEQSTEPSAFQRVLQRPQPIDLNKLDVALESDDESGEKIPEWPLLKKLREMERELLAAGNPIAVERQKIREYNRKLRNEMHEQEGIEEHLRNLQQLYLEYFAAQQLFLAQVLSSSWIQFTEEQHGLLETMEQQQEIDQRWYSLLREEQQLTRRRTRDAVLTDMLFLRPESSYETEHRSYFHIANDVLSNLHGFQDSGIRKTGGFKQPERPTAPGSARDDEEVIEVSVTEPIERQTTETSAGEELHQRRTPDQQPRGVDPNMDLERESTETAGSGQISSSNSPEVCETSSPDDQRAVSLKAGSSNSPEL